MRSALVQIILALATGYALLSHGGVTSPEWNLVLATLCCVSLLYWLPDRASAFAPAPMPAFSLLVAAFPAYIAFQLIPQPLSWISVLSPARADLVRALTPIQTPGWITLTVSPAITWAHLMRICAWILLFFLVRDISFRLPNRLWLPALPLVVFATFESIIGLAQHFGSSGPATGTYVNPDHFAGLLEMLLPFPVMLAVSLLRSMSEEPFESLGKAALVCLLLACSAAGLLAMLYSRSRMSVAAGVLEIAVLSALAARPIAGRRGGLAAGLLAVSAGVAFLLLAVPLGLIQRYSPQITTEARFQIWKETLSLIRHYPVFGCGLGTFVSAIQKYRTSGPLVLVDYAHNDYLQLFAETGAIGFAIALGILILMFKRVFRTARRELNRQRRDIAIACAAGLSGIALHSIVEFHFYIPASMMIAAWAAGLASGIDAERRQTPREAGFSPGPQAAPAMALRREGSPHR